MTKQLNTVILGRVFLPIVFLVATSCKQEHAGQVSRIEGKRVQISDSLESDPSILEFVKPFRDHINKDLDSVLAYAVDTYGPRPEDNELETALGNFMADVAFERASSVFKKRTGKDIDMALINHGGIRAPISKGDVSARSAYSVMPFDNALVVVDLKGEQVKELVAYLARSKRAHPFSGLTLKLNKDYEVQESLVNGEPIDPNKNYFVATYDYLYNGGNRMTFFQTNDSLYVLDYKMRNAMIDHFKRIDTIKAKKDGRFLISSQP